MWKQGRCLTVLTSKAEMTTLSRHRAVWRITWRNVCVLAHISGHGAIPIKLYEWFEINMLLVSMGHRVVSLCVGFWHCFRPFSSLLTCFYFSIPLDPHGHNDFQLKLHFPLYVVGGWAGSSLLLCPPEPLISGSYLILVTNHWGNTNILLIFENTELKFGALVTWPRSQREWVSDQDLNPCKCDSWALTTTGSSPPVLLRAQWLYWCFFWSSLQILVMDFSYYQNTLYLL